MIRLPARQNLTTNHAYKSRGTQRVTARTNNKYLAAVEMHCLDILEMYLLYEEKKPVMLFDVTEGKIYAYPYKKFKKELNESGRMSLTKQYDDALRGDQFVIFIRDSQKKKLISYSSGTSTSKIERCSEAATAAARGNIPDTPTWRGTKVDGGKGSNDRHGIGTDAQRRGRG